MLRCADNSLYTGIATDVKRRFDEHQAQGPKAARYVRGSAPLELVYQRSIGSRAEALSEEHRIKQLTRTAKEKLISADPG